MLVVVGWVFSVVGLAVCWWIERCKDRAHRRALDAWAVWTEHDLNAPSWSEFRQPWRWQPQEDQRVQHG